MYLYLLSIIRSELNTAYIPARVVLILYDKERLNNVQLFNEQIMCYINNFNNTFINNNDV